MGTRPITFLDYPVLCEWWEAYGWPPAPQDHLPKTGLIIPGICAGFLYRTDSAFALLEFVVGNPKVKDKEEALTLLISDLCHIAKQSGFKSVFTSLNHVKLMRVYTKVGFVSTDTNVTNFVKTL
jgi:hypothetical protein